MCLSLPVKIVSVENKKSEKKILAEVLGKRIEVSDFLVKARKGDYVYLQNNFIVGKISEKEVKEIINLIKNSL